MNKEFLKSVLLTGLIVLAVMMTKNLLDSKTPEAVLASDEVLATEENVINMNEIIYPQDFVIGFGGGSYTGVYSEKTRDDIWVIIKDLIPAYLGTLDLVVIGEEEYNAVEKTRSVQMTLPFSISLNHLGEVYDVEKGFHDILNSPVNQLIVSSSQQNRLYLGNDIDKNYFYLKSEISDDRLAVLINRINDETFTEYRRIDSLINFKNLKDDETQTFYNDEIMPITSLESIPFVKVTKEIDASADRHNSEIRTFLNKAFGSSTDFIKRLEEVDGSQSYIYGYGEKALRLGIDGKISYQEKLQSSDLGEALDFKEGLKLALSVVDDYGTNPRTLYLSGYESYDEDDHHIKVYSFDYRVKNLNVFTRSMTNGRAIQVLIKDDKVMEFTKNIRRYVKSIDPSEIWTQGPMNIEGLVNKNFALVSKNFNEDLKLNFRDEEGNWQMTTYVLSIMQNLDDISLYYYLDSSLDAERLIPAWRIEIADTLYYFHLYTGDVLFVKKINRPEVLELSRR